MIRRDNMEKDNRESIQPQKKVVLNDSDNVSREFTIQEEIGRGGSCIVYEATYEKDGVKRICRLKEFFPYGKEYDVYRGEGSILKITPAGEERFNNKKERFIEGCKKQMTIYTELSAARNSTVYAQSLYYGNNTVYCGMICDQGDSYDKIKDSGIKDVLETVKSTAQVLQHYHKAGYLHLDIKPANIFVLNETRELVKLFDFDSIIEQEEIRKGHIFSLGSSGYRAPELYKPNVKKIDVIADIYSLGAIVFERIFGRKVRLSDAFDSDIELPYDNKLFANSSSKLYKPLMEFLEKTCLSKSSYRRYQNVEELITAIDNMLEYTEIKFPLKKNLPSTISSFKGREELINDICDRIKNKGERKIFLHGQAGIGKTSLAIKCANELRDNYDGYFIVYRGTMKETIINLDFVNYNPLDEKNQYKSSDVIYKEKMELLSAYDDKTLLIIDNFDSNTDDLTQMENEPEYREVVNCGITVVITSRNYFEGCIDVNNLADDELFDLMRCFYTKAEQYKETMYEIIHAVDSHTFVVELVAKTLEDSHGQISAEKMLEIMKSGNFSNEQFTKVSSNKDNISKNDTIEGHIQNLFGKVVFKKVDIDILFKISLWPISGIDFALFMMVSGKDYTEDNVSSLINRGWVQINKTTDTIFLHPIIRGVIDKYTKGCDRIYNLLGNKEETYKQKKEIYLKAVIDAIMYVFEPYLKHPQKDIKTKFTHNQLHQLKEIFFENKSVLEIILKETDFIVSKAQIIHNYYKTLGLLNYISGNYNDAIEYFIRDINYGFDQWHIANYMYLSYIYERFQEYSTQKKYCLKAAKSIKKDPITHINDLSMLYWSVAKTYKILKKKVMYYIYIYKALRLLKKTIKWKLFYNTSIEENYFYICYIYRDLNMLHKSFIYCKKAAMLHFPPSQNTLGVMYYDGSGCKKNYSKAIELFKQAATNGNIDAISNLGSMYLHGYGCIKDYVKAFDCFYKVSAQSGRAASNLADMYYNGWGVEKNNRKALEYYKKARDLGENGLYDTIDKLEHEIVHTE